MKWSAISALLAAPLALAGVLSTCSTVTPTVIPPAVQSAIPSGSPTATQSATPTSSGEASTTQTVTVGSADGSLTYSPSALSGLQVGDVVQFVLANGAVEHTITQAQGDVTDCQADPNGVNHTFNPEDASSLVFYQPVESDGPFFAFCNVPGHCQAGMTFSVNA